LLCGKPPPLAERAFAAIVVFCVVLYRGGGVRPTLDAAHTAFAGLVWSAAPVDARS